jgi:quinol monooxygenase YgiN
LALHAEAVATRREAGNLRCDIFQQLAPRLNHFNMVALWRGTDDFEKHEAEAHSLRFRATLAPLLGALYDERLYRQIG